MSEVKEPNLICFKDIPLYGFFSTIAYSGRYSTVFQKINNNSKVIYVLDGSENHPLGYKDGFSGAENLCAFYLFIPKSRNKIIKRVPQESML